MTGKTEELLAVALELPATDRASLASALLRSLDEETSEHDVTQEEYEAAWSEELRRRAEELRSGRVTTIPWERARKELEESLARRDD